MPEHKLSAAIESEIQAAFEEAGLTNRDYASCVKDCKTDYEQCASAGNICRDQYKACLDACAKRHVKDPQIQQRLLKRLAAIRF